MGYYMPTAEDFKHNAQGTEAVVGVVLAAIRVNAGYYRAARKFGCEEKMCFNPDLEISNTPIHIRNRTDGI